MSLDIRGHSTLFDYLYEHSLPVHPLAEIEATRRKGSCSRVVPPLLAGTAAAGSSTSVNWAVRETGSVGGRSPDCASQSHGEPGEEGAAAAGPEGRRPAVSAREVGSVGGEEQALLKPGRERPARRGQGFPVYLSRTAGRNPAGEVFPGLEAP